MILKVKYVLNDNTYQINNNSKVSSNSYFLTSPWQLFLKIWFSDFLTSHWYSNGYRFCPNLCQSILYHYKIEWISIIKNIDYHYARRYGHIYRLIDDLIAMIDSKQFEIYPAELESKKENAHFNVVKFLGLNVTKKDSLLLNYMIK